MPCPFPVPHSRAALRGGGGGGSTELLAIKRCMVTDAGKGLAQGKPILAACQGSLWKPISRGAACPLGSLAHRIRKTWADQEEAFAWMFPGPIEADETFFGGKLKNMSHEKRKEFTGRGSVGKTAVAGVKDRTTGKVSARVVQGTDSVTLQGFVRHHAVPGTTVYTDEARAYQGMTDFDHHSVNHSVGEYVNDMAHTNGIESFWSMLKRDYQGIFHKIQP